MLTKNVEIEKNLNFLFPDCKGLEVRMLKVPKEGTVSGYYTNYKKLEDDVEKYNGKTNVFFTLNELNEGIISRSSNHLKSYATITTKDEEIIRRRYVLIDVDAKRPTGVSSTDIEHKKALELADEIKNHLKEEGFGCLISCDSGNGGHLLVPVDMDMDKDNNELIRNFLLVLDEKFTNEHAEVDITTYNPARICKLYGTVAVKGDSTDERPHRKSCILEDIDNFKITNVEKEVIESYVKKYGNKLFKKEKVVTVKRNVASVKTTSGFDVKQWVEEKGFEVTKIKNELEGTLFQIKPCMFETGHDEDNGFFIFQRNDGYLSCKCHHKKCAGLNFDYLWKKWEPNKTNPNQALKKDEKKSPQDFLFQIVEERGHFFFKNQFNQIYVSVPELNDVVWDIRSSEYTSYLLKVYLDERNVVIRKEVVKAVIDVLEGVELFNDDFRPTFARLGSLNKDSFFYYLNDSSKRMVAVRKSEDGVYDYEITNTGSEIMFVPTPSMKEQVAPNKQVEPPKTFIEYMSKYYGVLNDMELLLHNVLLCYRFLYGFGQPIAVFIGSKGSGKTTLCSFDALIVNPSINSVSAKPNGIKDWYVYLNNTDLSVIDNLSVLNKKESDLLCQAVQEFSVSSQRQLYSDNKMVTYKLYTSIYLSSIGLVSYQPDLLDRCIFFHTKRFNPDERVEEGKLRSEFEEDLPYIMTCIFDTISKALNMMEKDKKNGTFGTDKIFMRITSFQVYGVYLARAMGYREEDFINALKKNDKAIKTDLIVESDFAIVVKGYMLDRRYIKGTATAVLNDLKKYCSDKNLYLDQFANTPARFGKSLTDYEDILKSVGIAVKKRKSNGVRIVEMAIQSHDKYKELISNDYEVSLDDYLKDDKKLVTACTTQDTPAYADVIHFYADDTVQF